MTRPTLWTVLGVIVAVVIAWFIVDIVLRVAYLVFRIALVAIVAVIALFVLQHLFGGRRRRGDADSDE